MRATIHSSSVFARLGLLTALSCALGAALGGCGDEPTKAQCTALVDHIIDLEITAAGTDKLSPDMKADLEKQRQQLREYMRPAVDACLKTLPLAVVECGLAAKTLEERAACEKQ